MKRNQKRKLIKKAKTEMASAQIERILQEQREADMVREIRNVFQKMENEILKNLKTYWNDDVMFEAHREMILAPIHEYHKEYNDIIDKYTLKEFKKGYDEAVRIVKRKREAMEPQPALKVDFSSFFYGIGEIKNKDLKVGIVYPSADTMPKNEPPSFEDRKKALFGTDLRAENRIRKHNFEASQRTLARVDDQINEVLVDGYLEGWGQDGTAKKIMGKYAGFKDWEAKRIARTELHAGHNMGMMLGYLELDVEYIQWNCRVDGRQRDTHEKQDETIVEIGKEFKNGQKYPGDRSPGIPLEEFINCRCVAMPYIIPADKMAPPMARITPFKEEDLMPAKFNLEDELFKASQLKQEAEWRREQVKTITMKDLGLSRIEDIEKYHLYKPTPMDILLNFEDDIQTMGYEKWSNTLDAQFKDKVRRHYLHIRDKCGYVYEERMKVAVLKKAFPKEYDRILNQLDLSKDIKEFDINRLTVHQRENWDSINEYLNDGYFDDNPRVIGKLQAKQKEYEAICRDTNLYVEEVEVPLAVDGRSNGFGIGSENYENLETERFIRYNFLDKHYSIYISADGPLPNEFNPYEIRKLLEEKEDLIEDTFTRIFVSKQTGIYSPNGNHFVGGWSDTHGNIITFNSRFKSFKDTITHEGGHNIDGWLGSYEISGDPEYIKLAMEDIKAREELWKIQFRDERYIESSGNFEHITLVWDEKRGNIKRGLYKHKYWIEMSEKPYDNVSFVSQDHDQVWISGYAETKRYVGAPDLVEDWADSVSAYVHEREWFERNYPNRFKYIDKLFKDYEQTGKFELPFGQGNGVSSSTLHKLEKKTQDLFDDVINEIKAPPDPKEEFRRMRKTTWKELGLNGLSEADLDYMVSHSYTLRDDFNFGGVDYVKQKMKPRFRALILRSWDEGGSSNRYSRLSLAVLKKKYPRYYKKWYKEVEEELDWKLNKEYDENRLTKAQWNQLKGWERDEKAYLEGKDEMGWWPIVKPNAEKMRKEFDQVLHDKNLMVRDEYCQWEGDHGWLLTKKQFPNIQDEHFKAYQFKDRDYTIYISDDESVWFQYNPYEIRDIIDSQPKAVRDSLKRVFISKQTGVRDTDGMGIGGFANNDGNIACFSIDRDRKRFRQTITHEGGHAVDNLFGTSAHGFSGDDEYIKAVELDHQGRADGTIQRWFPTEGNEEYEAFSHLNPQNKDDLIWISKYAEEQRYPGQPDLVEDWAECITAYVHTPKWFKSNYPNTYQYIDDVFKTYEKTGMLKLPKGRLTNRTVAQMTQQIFDQKIKQPLMSTVAEKKPKKKKSTVTIPKRTSDVLSDEEKIILQEKVDYFKKDSKLWKAYQFESEDEYWDDLLRLYEDGIEDYMYHRGGYSDNSYWDEWFEALEIVKPDETAKIRKKFVKAKDLKRLSPAQRQEYDELMDIKKNDKAFWDELNKKFDNKPKKTLTRYNKIIKDKTVRTSDVTLDLGDTSNHIGDKSVPIGTTEDFTLYEFTDLNCKIYISKDFKQTGVSAQSIREYLLDAPKIERERFKRIAISSRKEIELNGRKVGGWSDRKGNVFMINSSKDEFFAILDHEAGHNIDGVHDWSLNEIFLKAHNEDVNDIYNGVRKRKPLNDPTHKWVDNDLRIEKIVQGKGKYEGPYVSSYGESHMLEQIDQDIHIMGGGDFFWDERMNEEWAECFTVYRHHPKWLKENYPRTYKVIDDMVKYYEDPNHLSWEKMPIPGDDQKLSKMIKGETKRYFDKARMKVYDVVEDLKPAGYDKFKLTATQERTYNKLMKKAKTEPLKFTDRHDLKDLKRKMEFSELHNKKVTVGLTGDEIGEYRNLSRMLSYDDEFKVASSGANAKRFSKKMFKNRNAFKFTKKQEELFNKLDKEHYEGDNLLDPIEKADYEMLKTQKNLDELHKKALGPGLDESETYEYITEFEKMRGFGVDLPQISPDLKFTTEKGFYERVYPNSFKRTGDRFALSETESDELYRLSKEEYIIAKGDTLHLEKTEEEIKAGMGPRKLKRLQDLRDQQDFNFLYYYNKEQGGLNYEKTKRYEELYDKFKKKFDLDESVLDQPISNYDRKIKFNSKETNFKKFRGTREDGLLPGGESISDYFTIDPRDMTPRELDVAEEWLGSNYRAFTDFETKCGRDVEKFANYCVECCARYNMDKDNHKYKYYRFYNTYSKALEFAKDIAHDMPVLDSIMSNQLKQGMTLWRVQENHHLGDLEVGSIVDFANNRSTAISKEGALWFEATNGKPMNYIIEIEAPTGTRCCYLAPIKQGTWYGHQYDDHPCSDQAYAREMEDLLKKSKVQIMKVHKKKVKGLTGNELTHITVRIVESG